MSEDLICGIDNGVSGALAFLGRTPGSRPFGMIPMPVQSKKKGREIDMAALRNHLTGHCAPISRMTVILEEPGGSKSASAAASMAASFGAIRGALQWAGAKIIRITPQKWQKEMLGNCEDTKKRALAVARELWPDETFLASERSRVPHDGMVDAALMCEYARRMNL